jgi:hypothetical protein
MSPKPDVIVCNPDASSSPRKAVFIHFEIMDAATFESTGKPYNIAMTHNDAMRLLSLLEAMSKKYDWPQAGVPEQIFVPPEKEQN